MSIENEESPEEKRLYERITNRILSSSYIQAIRDRLSSEKKIVILVDGPNFLRKIKDRQIKLEEIDGLLEGRGRCVSKKVILNEFASKNLIKAITNSGYEPIVTVHDIHVMLSIEIMNLLKDEKRIDLLVVASRHARLVPAIMKANEKDLETIVIGYEPGMSVALKKSTQQYFELH